MEATGCEAIQTGTTMMEILHLLVVRVRFVGT